jgi:tetratricopeptide (TPR) repeat protein
MPTVGLSRTSRERGSGPKFGRYHVLEPLGEGGMARVFLAYDPQLHRKVAIKLLKRPKDGASHSSARLVREAQALAQLSHPNLVHVYEVGEQAGEVFVVMEYIRGQTLSQWIAARRRSCADVITVLAGAGRGLASAHRANIVHRDFKPANVVIDRDGIARVVDFGIAVLGGDGLETSGVLTETKAKARHAALSLHFTEGGSVMGTPPYMAPEQHLGQDLDARTDQFSFAVTLFEALYRVRPFPDDIEAMIAAKNAGDIRFPNSDSVPGRVRAVLRRALAPDPGKRFASMQELLVALESSRRVLWLMIGGSAAIASFAGLVGMTGTPRPSSNCDAPPPRLAEVWNDERRAAVEESFRAVEHPFAEHSFATVSSSIDRYAAEWKESFSQSCRATRVDGTQSEELLDLRMGCLDRSLDGLAALVEVFAGADTGVVERSVLAVADLTPVALCADEPRLRDEKPLPTDPRVATAVEAARAELARVDALIDAGRFVTALERARMVAADAERLGHAPLLAEAQFLLGQASEDDPAAAEAAYRAAIHAANLGRHDLVSARAWTALIENVGVKQSRLDEAISLATGAEAAVVRVDADGSMTAVLAGVLGKIASAKGRYDEAIAQYRRAERIIVTAYGPDDPRLRVFVNNLGVVLLQQGKWSEALAQFEEALAHGERTLGADHPYIADYIINIGLVHLERHDGAGARITLERALAILERDPEANHRRLAVTRANLGNALYMQGEHEAARTVAAAALAEFEVLLGERHTHVAGVVDVLALVAMQQGEPEEAERLFVRAERILQEVLGATHPLMATVRMHHAELLLHTGRAEAAEPMLVEAEAVLRVEPGAAHPDHAIAEALLAEARLERDATAQDVPLSTAIVRMRPLDHHYRARARFALARAHWAAGRHDDAVVAARAARAQLEGPGVLDDFVGRTIVAWLADNDPLAR